MLMKVTASSAVSLEASHSMESLESPSSITRKLMIPLGLSRSRQRMAMIATVNSHGIT
jgi:hypothetical protein